MVPNRSRMVIENAPPTRGSAATSDGSPVSSRRIHTARLAGSSQASNRRSADAGMRRRTVTAVIAQPVPSPRRPRRPSRPRRPRRPSRPVACQDEGLERGEPLLPELPVPLHPRDRLGEPLGPERQHVIAAAHRALHELGPLEHLDVLARGVQRDREGAREVGDPGVRHEESIEDGPPRRVGHRAQHGVHLIFTHEGECTPQVVGSQQPTVDPDDMRAERMPRHPSPRCRCRRAGGIVAAWPSRSVRRRGSPTCARWSGPSAPTRTCAGA